MSGFLLLASQSGMRTQDRGLRVGGFGNKYVDV